nr:hypothetical protein [uncultured Mediterranean phage uvMED]
MPCTLQKIKDFLEESSSNNEMVFPKILLTHINEWEEEGDK